MFNTPPLRSTLPRTQKLTQARDEATPLTILNDLITDTDEEVAAAVWDNPTWIHGTLLPLALEISEGVRG